MSHPDSPCTYKTPMLSALQEETLTFCRIPYPNPHLPWIAAEGRKTWQIWKCKNQVLPSARIKVKMEEAVVKWAQPSHWNWCTKEPTSKFPKPMVTAGLSHSLSCGPREERFRRWGNQGFAFLNRINKRWMVSGNIILLLWYYVLHVHGERNCNPHSELSPYSNRAGTGRRAPLSVDTETGLQCSLPEKSNEVPREPAEVSEKLMLMDPLQAKDRLRITQYQHNSTLSTALRVLRSESERRLWHLSASQPCYYCLPTSRTIQVSKWLWSKKQQDRKVNLNSDQLSEETVWIPYVSLTLFIHNESETSIQPPHSKPQK